MGDGAHLLFKFSIYTVCFSYSWWITEPSQSPRQSSREKQCSFSPCEVAGRPHIVSRRRQHQEALWGQTPVVVGLDLMNLMTSNLMTTWTRKAVQQKLQLQCSWRERKHRTQFTIWFRIYLWGLPEAQTVKNLPAVQETQVRSLGQEDPLEKEIASHSSILACRIPRIEEAGGLQSMGSQRVRHNWATAAAAAKSHQSCPTLCDPIDGSPPGSPRPWDSPGKNTGVGCHFLLRCMKVKSESEVAQLCPTLSDPMDCSPPGSSVHGIFQARVLIFGKGNWLHNVWGLVQNESLRPFVQKLLWI